MTGVMKPEQTVDVLLGKLILHWHEWERHEKFYLEDLAPQLVEKPESGDDTERAILNSLRGILNDNKKSIGPKHE